MSDYHELGPLLNRLQAGDMQAVDALVAKIRPYLHLLVRQKLEPHQWHKLGDSDIVQETLMRIHRALSPDSMASSGQFDGRTPPQFLAWIGQIIHNVILDLERRGEAIIRDHRREVSGSKIFVTLIKGSNPGLAAERAERALLLAAALERLPQRQREVLVYRFFEQLSYAEISERTGKSEGALRIVVARALESLRHDEGLLRLAELSS